MKPLLQLFRNGTRPEILHRLYAYRPPSAKRTYSTPVTRSHRGSRWPLPGSPSLEKTELEPVAVQFTRNRSIDLTWKDGLRIQLNSLFLRDHCRCSDCQFAETKQRKVHTFAIPIDIEPSAIHSEPDGLSVTWTEGRHRSKYSWQWLRARVEPSPTDLFHLRRQHSFFDPTPKQAPPPTVSYNHVASSDTGVREWTDLICRYGFCLVDDCPVDPDATESLLKLISYVRHTHYGGFYDFTSDLALKDTAYTSVALDAHTDTTYFTDPAGLQMFHLLSHTGGQGGSSILVDGFEAARRLKRLFPEAFEILSSQKIPWHASGNEGISITPTAGSFPVIQTFQSDGVDEPAISEPLLHQIRWNNSDRGAMRASGDLQDWYGAAKKWHNILLSPGLEYRFQLQPGKALIFDNWRMLHGRSAFSGARRMCGGYINMDDFVSKWKLLNLGEKTILEQI